MHFWTAPLRDLQQKYWTHCHFFIFHMIVKKHVEFYLFKNKGWKKIEVLVLIGFEIKSYQWTSDSSNHISKMITKLHWEKIIFMFLIKITKQENNWFMRNFWSCSFPPLLWGQRCASPHLFQNVREELFGVSQLILPLLGYEGSTVRAPGPQESPQCCAAVTVLTWNANINNIQNVNIGNRIVPQKPQYLDLDHKPHPFWISLKDVFCNVDEFINRSGLLNI